SGHGAAKRVIELMHHSQGRLSPRDIIKADDPKSTDDDRAQALWNDAAIRKATIKSLADSTKLQADLWTSAWIAGSGSKLKASAIHAYDEGDFDDLYRKDKSFVPSLSLAAMASSGKFEPH